jgi:glycosyltransferase involved in cell wall biosynthesis
MQHVTPYDNEDFLVIGWQGSSTHETDFKIIMPALKMICDEHPNVMFRFLGNVPEAIKGIIPNSRFQYTKGVPFEKYPPFLKFAHFDIGLAPITPSHFNESKSNLKWMEYGAIGVPCVASNWYPYARSIEEGVTGFLARNVEEWYTKIKRLVESPELRQTVGANAYQEVWENWSDTKHAYSWINAFRSIKAGYERWLTDRHSRYPTPMARPSQLPEPFLNQPQEERKPTPTGGTHASLRLVPRVEETNMPSVPPPSERSPS